MPDLEDLSPHLKRVGDMVYGGRLKLNGVQVGAYDQNWLREHDLFYSKQSGSYPYLTRALICDGEDEAGFAHVRPLSDGLELSETYLAPPSDKTEAESYYWTCAQNVTDYGQPKVRCVPFITPDTLFSMCAQASVWICVRLLHEISGGVIDRLDMPAIQTMSRGHPFADFGGLPFSHVARVLRMCKCNAFYFESETLPYEQMEFCLYAYIESGLPVIIGVDVGDVPWWLPHESGYHSIVAIGHTMEDGSVDSFLFHDESTYPYQRLTMEDLKAAWHQPRESDEKPLFREAIVAVPPRVSLPVDIAFQVHSELMRVLISDKKLLSRSLATSSLRPHLVHLSQLVFDFVSETPAFDELDAEKVEEYLSSDWYWVVEMLSPKRKQRRGFFVLDATGGDFYAFYSKVDRRLIAHHEGAVQVVEDPA